MKYYAYRVTIAAFKSPITKSERGRFFLSNQQRLGYYRIMLHCILSCQMAPVVDVVVDVDVAATAAVVSFVLVDVAVCYTLYAPAHLIFAMLVGSRYERQRLQQNRMMIALICLVQFVSILLSSSQRRCAITEQRYQSEYPTENVLP